MAPFPLLSLEQVYGAIAYYLAHLLTFCRDAARAEIALSAPQPSEKGA